MKSLAPPRNLHRRIANSAVAQKTRVIVKYVEKPVSKGKTSIIFIFLLIAAGLLIWQLVGKIRSYYENPVVIDTQFDYPNRLAFPAIVLCNKNRIRVTKQNLTTSDASTFFRQAAHQREQLILSCSAPGGKGCGEVLPVKTDAGLCYGLNLNGSQISVTSAGSSNAVELLLNIEDYESDGSQQRTVGVSVGFHSPSSTLVMSQSGLDAAPGSQTSLGLRLQRLTRLPKHRKGNCDPDATLQLYKHYSYQGCKLEGWHLVAMEACGCKAWNVPDETGVKAATAVCSRAKHTSCLEPRLADAGSKECPESCSSQVYQPALSYSTISVPAVKAAITEAQHADMESRFRAALETRAELESSGNSSEFDQLVAAVQAAAGAMEGLRMTPDPASYQELPDRLGGASICSGLGGYGGLGRRPRVSASAALRAAESRLLADDVVPRLRRHAASLHDPAHSHLRLWDHLVEFEAFKSSLEKESSTVNDASANASTVQKAQMELDTTEAGLRELEQSLLSNVSSALAYAEAAEWEAPMANDTFANATASFAPSAADANDALKACLASSNSTLRGLARKGMWRAFHLRQDEWRGDVAGRLKAASAYRSAVGAERGALEKCRDDAGALADVLWAYSEAREAALAEYAELLHELHRLASATFLFHKSRTATRLITRSDAEWASIAAAVGERGSGKLALAKHLVPLKEYSLTAREHLGRLRDQMLKTGLDASLLKSRFEGISSPYLGTAQKALELFPVSDSVHCLGEVSAFLDRTLGEASGASASWRSAFDALVGHLSAYLASFTVTDYFYRRNVAILRIYYADLVVQKVEQRLTYQTWGMISDVGGTVGVLMAFIGGSGMAIWSGCSSMASSVKGRVAPGPPGTREARPEEHLTREELEEVATEEGREGLEQQAQETQQEILVPPPPVKYT